MRPVLTASLILSTFAAPALADSTAGTILAFDRVARIIVLDDKSVWPLGATEMVPADLEAGDKIVIDFKSDGDNGIAMVNHVTRAAN